MIARLGKSPMKPNEILEQLLNDCVLKANAYINAVRERGQFHASVLDVHQAWEDAEALYAAQLALVSEKKHSVDHVLVDG